MYETNSAANYNMPTIGPQTNDVPRISRLTGNVHKAIATNLEVIETLEQRLHSALLPCGPPVSGQGARAERDVTSPLASDLESFEAQLYSLSGRITDILNRLEL